MAEIKFPFQVQLRSFGKRKDYWIVLPDTSMPEKISDVKARVIAIPSSEYDNFTHCMGRIRAFKDSGKNTRIWNCKEKGKTETDCEIVEEGTFSVDPSASNIYTISYLKGKNAGKTINFKWQRMAEAKESGFVMGAVITQKCSESKEKKEVEIKKTKKAEKCTDIWDKEKRWKYYKTPWVEKSMYNDIKGHPFRFVYVSTTQREKVPEEERTPTTGVGVWKRKSGDEVLHIPDSVKADKLGEFFEKTHSGITEIHYEPSVMIDGGVKKAKKVEEIIIDMDITKGYPFDNVTEVAKLSQKIAPKIMEKYLKINPDEIKDRIVFTGKSSYHHHIKLPKGKGIEYGGVDTMKDPNTVSGIICKIGDAINKELGENRVVCGEGHGKQIGFDFASCNAPGKNCVVPFSFRIPDESKGINTCYVAVPVNFKKIPNFKPEMHATADFVMKNEVLFK